MRTLSFGSAMRKSGWLLGFLVCAGGTWYFLAAALRGPEVSWSLLSGAMLFFALLPLSLARLADVTARRRAVAAADPAATLDIRQSALSRAAIMLMFLAMSACCAFGLREGVQDITLRVLVWIGLVAFLASAIDAPFRGASSARMTLSPAGLDYSGFKIGPIAWTDIERAEQHRVLRSQVIALFVRDEEKYFRRGFKRPGRLLGWTKYMVPSLFLLPDAMFDVSLDWLLEAIQVRIDHFGAAGQSASGRQHGVPA